MKTTAIIVSCICSVICGIYIQAQTLTRSFPELDSLLSLLNRADSLSFDADLAEFNRAHRFSLLCLIPSVGMNAITLKPSTIFSASGIVSFFRNKRAAKNKIVALSKKSMLQHSQHQVKLIRQYQELKNNLSSLNMVLSQYQLHQKFYKLKALQYQSCELDPELFLKEMIAQEDHKKGLISQIDHINTMMTDIEMMLNTSIFHPITYESVLH